MEQQCQWHLAAVEPAQATHRRRDAPACLEPIRLRFDALALGYVPLGRLLVEATAAVLTQDQRHKK